MPRPRSPLPAKLISTRAPAKTQGSVRIIAGVHRGRVLHFPASPGLRPTPDRVRETLFNWLGQYFQPHERCLDLFAGSGALGFEALSRGMGSVTLVERERSAALQLRANAQLLGGAVQVLEMDALSYLSRTASSPSPVSGGFDVVLIDPPYALDIYTECFAQLPPLLNPGALVYAEADHELLPAGFVALKRSRQGAVHFALFAVQQND